MVAGIIIVLTVLSVVGCIRIKNPTAKLLLGMNTIILLALLLLIGSYVYVTKYKITDIDTSVSPDGKYEVLFQSVGDPDWPFGHSHARITLRQDDKTIEQFKLAVANDGREDEGQFYRACEKLYRILQKKGANVQNHRFTGHHNREYIMSYMETYLRFYGCG